MEMHERIQLVLTSKGMSQADICRLTGLDSGKVSQVVSGRTKDPRISTIVPIAQALNVSLDFLVFGESAKASFTDKGQIVLNDCFESMNEKGRERLIDEAEMLAKRSDFAKSEDHKVTRTA